MARHDRTTPPTPTLGELQRENPKWFWACCNSLGCTHKEPIALAPFVIRWGPEASSDLIRESLRCTVCGHKGVTLIAPSWVDMDLGYQPFPAERLRPRGTETKKPGG